MRLRRLFRAIEDALPTFDFIEAVGVEYEGERRSLRVWYSGGDIANALGDLSRLTADNPALAEDLEKVKLELESVIGPFTGAAVPEPGGAIRLAPSSGALARGTLGCFVSLDPDPGPYLLTAAHIVLGGRVGDPFMLDCGPSGVCQIGELFKTGDLKLGKPTSKPWNRADSALGRVTAAKVNHQPAGKVVVFSGDVVDKPRRVMGRSVAKVGAASGIQKGEVSWYPASLGVSFEIQDDFGKKLKGYFQNQVIVKGSGFAAFGDSGSLVVLSDKPEKVGDPKEGDALGILAAGTTTQAAGAGPMDRFLVSPMPGVRKQLKLDKLKILK